MTSVGSRETLSVKNPRFSEAHDRPTTAIWTFTMLLEEICRCGGAVQMPGELVESLNCTHG